MLFDNILKEIGEFGWYQRRVYILASLPSLLLAFESLSVVFIFVIPDHRCALPDYDSDTFEIQDINHSLLVNRTIPLTDGKYDQCHVYNNASVVDVRLDDLVSENDDHVSFHVNKSALSSCKRWVYDFSTFESTIATDFDVVCQRTFLRASSNMIAEIGTFCGTIFIGIISDWFGRKIPFYIGGLALVGGGFGIAFTRSLITLNVCRFILGIARIAVFVNGIVIGTGLRAVLQLRFPCVLMLFGDMDAGAFLCPFRTVCTEIVGPSKRAWAGILIELFWCMGEFLLLLMAYFIRNWRYLEIALSVPSIGLLFYWWIIPESPRWLSARGRDAEALQILERIAKSNNTKMPQVEDASQLMKGEEQVALCHAIRSKELLIRIAIVFCCMFVLVMVYYGLSLNISNLGGNIFINFAFSVVLEMLGYSCALLLVNRVGRKPLQCGSLIIAGSCCTLSFLPVILDMPSWVLVVLSAAGRFMVSLALAVIFLYAAELFPTVVRSTSVSVAVTFSRLGSILSPFVADLGFLVRGRYEDALPLVLMGLPALLAGLLSLRLPETLNTTLPETLEDLERPNMQRRCPCCMSSTQVENVLTVDAEDRETTQC